MLPTFLGLGAPKAATTWLARCLDEHPSVFITDVKETEYFSWRHTMQDLGAYKEHFRAAGPSAEAVGEISTSYLHWEGTPDRAHAVVPEAHLFASLRDPVEQIHSHYWHLRRQNFHQQQRSRPASLEEALDLYPEKLLRPARYAEHLARWLTVYDRDQVHVIFYEDIQNRPDDVVENLYRFLNVDASFRPSVLKVQDRSVRRGTSPRSETLERMYTRLYDILTQYVYFPLRHTIGRRVAEAIKNRVGVREMLEGIFRRDGYPDMAPDLQADLRSEFADDIRDLETLTGRDLQHWIDP